MFRALYGAKVLKLLVTVTDLGVRMKVAFWIFATCIVYVIAVEPLNLDPTRLLEQKVNIHKKAVELELKYLQRHQKQTYEFTQKKTSDKNVKAKEGVDRTTKDTVKAIRKLVDDANSNGKNAETCYNTADTQLNGLNEISRATLDTCVSNAMNYLDPALQNIATAIQAAETLITEANGIIPDCNSSDLVQMKKCVKTKLSTLLSSTVKLRTQGSSAKIKLTVSSASSIKNAGTCITKTLGNMRAQSAEVKVAAKTCVNNL